MSYESPRFNKFVKDPMYQHFKFHIFSLASFVLLLSSDCFAANVDVTVNVTFGGTVTDASDNLLGGASATLYVKRAGITLPNFISPSWTSSNVAGSLFGTYGARSGSNPYNTRAYTFTVTNVGTSTSTAYVEFDYTVLNSQGANILHKVITKSIEIKNINPLILNGQTYSENIDLSNETLKQDVVVGGGGGGGGGGSDVINYGSALGFKEYGILTDDKNGLLKVYWKSAGLVPKDHWIVITEAGAPYKPCQAGFKLGRNTINSTVFALRFAPEKYGVDYTVRICPIYNPTNDAPGLCYYSAVGGTVECGSYANIIKEKLPEGGATEQFANLQIANNFHPTAAMSYDWGSLKESWFYSATQAQWFYYVPGTTDLDGGKLYSNTYDPPVSGVIAKQNFRNNVSLDILQADLTSQTAGFVSDKMFRDLPLAVRVPSVMGNIEESTATEEARFLAFDYSLGVTRVGATNWSQVYNEKWVFAEKKQYTEATTQVEKNKNWLYVLPSGVVYRWDGVSAGANLTGTFEMKLTPRYYDFLDKTADLQESYVQRVYGFEKTSSSLSYNYNGSLTFNYNGVVQQGVSYYEKWIRSRRNGAWYYILPGGAIYKWDGAYPIKFTNKVGVLSHSSYRDPNAELLNFPYTP